MAGGAGNATGSGATVGGGTGAGTAATGCGAFRVGTTNAGLATAMVVVVAVTGAVGATAVVDAED
jgi:hypothetical protein